MATVRRDNLRGRALLAWRRSLPLRVVSISLALSTLAIVVIGGYIAVSIGGNLFDQRRDEVLAESVRATEQAREVFDGSIAVSISNNELVELRSRAIEASLRVISNRGATSYGLLRVENQSPTSITMENQQSPDFDVDLITPELRELVSEGQGPPYYQSVSIQTGAGTTPGIIVGTLVSVPGAGDYQLYFVYDLGDIAATLSFTQNTMLIGGIALLALILGVTLLVVRMVVGPVEVAAATSEKLAAGEFDERIPVKGEDVLARLGKSYNRMADSIQSQITRLAALSTVQQRFVSDVSHELRTPLTTIRLAGDVIYDRRAEFDPVTERTAELLYQQVQRFDLLLSDLLEMSRFDAGAASLDKEPTNLVRLAEVEADAVRPLAEDNGTLIEVVAPGGHVEVDVDPRRVRRILQNLLGNAIDHGDSKPITITIDSNSTAVAIGVQDRGIGMTPEETERVFDRFWRADPSRQRRTGGTGLGLAISQEDAALHGGVVDVWSEQGVGTCFRLTLPRDPKVEMISPIALPPVDAHEELDRSSEHEREEHS
ncbi:MtrAB system histidine kinase MtrB [Humidisolicoccus flavus]|uniref:MtrAB system histidine kinase MtrB n=1 Tax=Humidisolicoccus flavus TaxID=3111414 RepID=UPI00325100A3